jgi:hypothetical protein
VCTSKLAGTSRDPYVISALRFRQTGRGLRMLPPAGTVLNVAYVWKTEEKGSDVNLGVHLVRDAFQGKFDEAAVLTNDTDLVEAIRIVRYDVGLPITLLAPNAMPSASLSGVANHTRHISGYLGPCQFPDPVPRPGKRPIRKPASW